MDRNEEAMRLKEWKLGRSTRYSKNLTCKDIKLFLEEKLNLKCGRIVRRKNNSTHAIEFVIHRPFTFRKRAVLQSPLIIQSLGENKIIFIAYDFNFELFSDYDMTPADKRCWLDYMTKKFGKPYEEFMLTYSET